MTDPAQTALNAHDARALDDDIRNRILNLRDDFAELRAALVRAEAGQIHIALGWRTFTEYAADVFKDAGTAIDRPERAELGRLMHEEYRMSTRAIASVLGVSHTTVRADRQPTGRDLPVGDITDPAPAPRPKVVGLDGREYKPPKPRQTPRKPLPDQFARAVNGLDQSTQKMAALITDGRIPSHIGRFQEAHTETLRRAYRSLIQTAEALAIDLEG